MNFVSLRGRPETAQREIGRYADAVEQLFVERMPVTYEALVALGPNLGCGLPRSRLRGARASPALRG